MIVVMMMDSPGLLADRMILLFAPRRQWRSRNADTLPQVLNRHAELSCGMI